MLLTRVVTWNEDLKKVIYKNFEVEEITSFNDLWRMGVGNEVIYQAPYAFNQNRELYTIREFKTISKWKWFRKIKKNIVVLVDSHWKDAYNISERHFNEFNPNSPKDDYRFYKVIKEVKDDEK